MRQHSVECSAEDWRGGAVNGRVDGGVSQWGKLRATGQCRATSSDAAQRLGRPCFRASTYSSVGQSRGEVERAVKGRVGASPAAFGHMAISF